MLIYISAHLPSRSIPEAGQKIAYQNLNSLLEKRNDICAVIFVNSVEEKYFCSSNFSSCVSFKVFKVSNFTRIKNSLLKFKFPILYSSRFNSSAASYVNSIINEESDYDLFLDYEQVAIYLWHLNKISNSTTIFFHDVNSQLYYRKYISTPLFNVFKRLFYFLEYKKYLKYEKLLAKKEVSAVVISDKDKDLLINLGFDKSKISVKAPVVSEYFYSLNRSSNPDRSFFFWGAMNRIENQEAVRWFLDCIYPFLQNFKFYVVGANLPDSFLKPYKELHNVEFVGFVEDPSLYFENCALMIAPILNGAGVKIKVLEALAAKVPVVSTSVGAEGIDENDLLKIADGVDDFVKEILATIDLT